MSYSLRQNPANPNNSDSNRKAVDRIVIHHAATTDFDGIGRTFASAASGVSAHYGVGRSQNVDQYVPEARVAYHAGNYPVNQSSIGIENVNSSGAPNWDIDEATFNTLVELCRDVARRHNLLPLMVGKNLFGHKDFRNTACPGQLYGRLQELANKVNDSFVDNTPNPSPAPRKSEDVIANEVIAGAWGNNPDRANRLNAAGYNANAIQALVNKKLGAGTSAPVASKPSASAVADQVIAGAWGNGDERKSRLEAAGYSYQEVQDAVNRKLGAGGSAPSKPSNEQIANEVIAGKWGNNPERRDKLQAAGYDAGAVQALVNKKLGF